MTTLGYTPFDCDNHYYEALDAFTRHVPREWQKRCVQWCDIDGRKYHLVGGEVSKAVSNPTWDPIAKPGALHEYFRGNPTGRSPLEMLKDREPLPGEYMDRDLRVKKIKEQGLRGVWLFPTLGVLYEELLKNDIEAVKVQDNVVIVTVIGSGLFATSEFVGRLFTALGEKNVDVLSITQGTTGGSISVVVSKADTENSVRAIHELIVGMA